MSIDDEIDDEDVKRRRALSEICRISRHGVVDGVEFDFRHELLDPREWQMDTIAVEPRPLFNTGPDPFIWFPCYGEFSKIKLRREAKLLYEHQMSDLAGLSELIGRPEDQLSNKITPVEEYVRDGTPDCIIQVGDKISIKDVRRTFMGDEFDHRHDKEVRYASLNVIRSDGKIDAIPKSIRFDGAASILTSFFNITFLTEFIFVYVNIFKSGL